jgi:transposase
MTTKVHAICDEKGRAGRISVPARNISDLDGTRTLLTCGELPPAKAHIADCGYDAQWIRDLVAQP